MQNSYAILIDGAFVKQKLGTAKSPIRAEQFSALVEKIRKGDVLSNMRLHRVYYYDAKPLEKITQKPLGGGKINFGKNPIVSTSAQLFNQLKQLPYFALRIGELSFSGWRVVETKLKSNEVTAEITENDLRPNIQQKGVDMRIGMDIAALALKKQVQVIVLLSGDSDFVPAMKFARREGIQVYLITLGHHIKPSMYEHSDLFIKIDS